MEGRISSPPILRQYILTSPSIPSLYNNMMSWIPFPPPFSSYYYGQSYGVISSSQMSRLSVFQPCLHIHCLSLVSYTLITNLKLFSHSLHSFCFVLFSWGTYSYLSLSYKGDFLCDRSEVLLNSFQLCQFLQTEQYFEGIRGWRVEGCLIRPQQQHAWLPRS